MPKVTVVIPAYNVEAYIEASIRSVLEQRFTDFEVLVVNDGSTDGTVARVAAFADPRLRVVTQANRGLAGARNGGIRAARGEYIAFLDADDLWTPDKLARHVAHLDAQPTLGVSYCQSAFIDDAGSPLGAMQAPQLRNVSAKDVFLRNPVGNGSAPVIRRAALDAIRFAAPRGDRDEAWYFDEDFRQSEDIECWMRIALTTTWRFEGIEAPLTLYRVNSGGLSANLQRQLATWEAMVHKASGYAPAFVAQWASRARGYQLRYLARRALRMGDTRGALALLRQALGSHPGLVWEEPLRTLATCAAALVQACVPPHAYRHLEALGLRAAGWLSRTRVPRGA